MDECPCKNCLVLGRCKAVYLSDLVGFLTTNVKKCNLLEKYIAIEHLPTRIKFSFESLIEVGKIFDFKLEKHGNTINLKRNSE